MDTLTYLRALEADKSGNWEQAHELIQHLPTQEAAWIHAYLHRKEGDRWNAQYWYDRAGKSFFEGSLEEEWDQIYQALS
jgi:hypothetical protein